MSSWFIFVLWSLPIFHSFGLISWLAVPVFSWVLSSSASGFLGFFFPFCLWLVMWSIFCELFANCSFFIFVRACSFSACGHWSLVFSSWLVFVVCVMDFSFQVVMWLGFCGLFTNCSCPPLPIVFLDDLLGIFLSAILSALISGFPFFTRGRVRVYIRVLLTVSPVCLVHSSPLAPPTQTHWGGQLGLKRVFFTGWALPMGA